MARVISPAPDGFILPVIYHSLVCTCACVYFLRTMYAPAHPLFVIFQFSPPPPFFFTPLHLSNILILYHPTKKCVRRRRVASNFIRVYFSFSAMLPYHVTCVCLLVSSHNITVFVRYVLSFSVFLASKFLLFPGKKKKKEEKKNRRFLILLSQNAHVCIYRLHPSITLLSLLGSRICIRTKW